MVAIWKREFFSYFRSPVGYVITAVFLFMMGLYASTVHFSAAMSGFEYTLYTVCFVYLILIPLLTMRSLSEERRHKTDQLLLSLPLRSCEIVLGKYFAMLAVLLFPLLISGVIPLILEFYGQVNLTLAYSALLAFALLGAALTAMGMFLSSLTENPIICAILSFVVMLCAYFMGSLSAFLSSSPESALLTFLILSLGAAAVLFLLTKKTVPSLLLIACATGGLLLLYFLAPTALEQAFAVCVSSLGIFDRFYLFVNGIFDWQCILYYLSICFLFVFFTILSVEKRRWS